MRRTGSWSRRSIEMATKAFLTENLLLVLGGALAVEEDAGASVVVDSVAGVCRPRSLRSTVSPVASSSSAMTSPCLCTGHSRDTNRDMVLSRDAPRPGIVPEERRDCMMRCDK